MTHVHGVLWLAEHLNAPYRLDGGYDDEKIPQLIDEWISCSIDTGNDRLNALVKEVNCHNHTKSCKKGLSTCHFNFPRFPSKKTLIATPLSDDFLIICSHFFIKVLDVFNALIYID